MLLSGSVFTYDGTGKHSLRHAQNCGVLPSFQLYFFYLVKSWAKNGCQLLVILAHYTLVGAGERGSPPFEHVLVFDMALMVSIFLVEL